MSMFDFTVDFTGLFDEMFKRMQEPGARERMQKAFDATPEELGKAALAKAQRDAEARKDSGTHYDDMDMADRQSHNH